MIIGYVPINIDNPAVKKSNSRYSRLHRVEAILLAVAIFGVGLAGCSKKSDSMEKPSSSAAVQPDAPPIAPPPPAPLTPQRDTASGQGASSGPATAAVMEPIMMAWQQGDKSLAVSRFVEANWSARPLFAPGSTLSLSESQLGSLPITERGKKQDEPMKQVGNLKQLALAVLQAGRDAASNKDSSQARKYFTSVKHCGEALEGPDFALLINQIAKMMKRMADEELGKLGQ
jgi:hypothetical protein